MQQNIKTFVVNIFIPILIGIFIAVQLYQTKTLINNLNNVLGSMIGIIATLFGFIITALSILLTIQGNEKTKQIRDSKHYKTILLTYLIAAFYMLVSLLIFIIFYSFGIVNKFVSFIYLFLTTVCFVYLILALIYLGIMILTLFHKKIQYH